MTLANQHSSSLPFSQRGEEIHHAFSSLSSEATYQLIMEWGKRLPPFETSWKTEENLVPGCQSVMHLKTTYDGEKLTFYAASDALISAGIAALLIHLYSDETPEVVLTSPPTILEELGITSSLSPSRANGLASLYLKMKQAAIKALVDFVE